MKAKFFAVIAFLFALTTFAQEFRLAPQPKQLDKRDGEFVVTAATKIVIANNEDRVAAETLADEIHSATGRKPAISLGKGGSIVLQRGPKGDDDRYSEEGYTLEANRLRVIISAPAAAGVFYGAQTLRQLLVPDGKRLVCPGVFIKDWPTMKWRGVHDDVSRGPIPTLDYMKQQVRTLAE